MLYNDNVNRLHKLRNDYDKFKEKHIEARSSAFFDLSNEINLDKKLYKGTDRFNEGYVKMYDNTFFDTGMIHDKLKYIQSQLDYFDIRLVSDSGNYALTKEMTIDEFV